MFSNFEILFKNLSKFTIMSGIFTTYFELYLSYGTIPVIILIMSGVLIARATPKIIYHGKS